jgi:hypothetical protein
MKFKNGIIILFIIIFVFLYLHYLNNKIHESFIPSSVNSIYNKKKREFRLLKESFVDKTTEHLNRFFRKL